MFVSKKQLDEEVNRRVEREMMEAERQRESRAEIAQLYEQITKLREDIGKLQREVDAMRREYAGQMEGLNEFNQKLSASYGDLMGAIHMLELCVEDDDDGEADDDDVLVWPEHRKRQNRQNRQNRN